MPLILRLLPAIVGIGALPWLLVGFAFSGEALTGRPWLLGSFALTSVGSIAVLFAVVRKTRDAPWRRLAHAMKEGASTKFQEPLHVDVDAGVAAEVMRAVEAMRHKLVAHVNELGDSMDLEKRTAIKRKAEEAAASQKYVDAHEVFMKSFCCALKELSEGNLTLRLETAFSTDYEQLRHCFNESVDRLGGAFARTTELVHNLSNSTHQISTAADSLSNRTCQQAASLEQTSAALKQITTTVKKTADNAQHARSLVSEIRSNAEDSSTVVGEAIGAMERIEKSSQEIEQIIGVIDEIAFQTNLLALNAGVEAARAGEAGRGFAVVASEVRALAQRSAEAAKGIKGLIASSTSQVRDGVQLVGKTGQALSSIVSQVGEANDFVAEIAAGNQEQSQALLEVNGALVQMDQFTQENAAMVEETTAATKTLDSDIHKVVDAISAFKFAATPPAIGSNSQLRQPAPERPPRANAARQRGGGATALKVNETIHNDDWEEF